MAPTGLHGRRCASMVNEGLTPETPPGLRTVRGESAGRIGSSTQHGPWAARRAGCGDPGADSRRGLRAKTRMFREEIANQLQGSGVERWFESLISDIEALAAKDSNAASINLTAFCTWAALRIGRHFPAT